MAEHIILRDAAGIFRRQTGPALAGPATLRADPRKSGPTAPDICIADLDTSGLGEALADPSILAVARSMDTRLVAPQPMDELRPDEAEPGWGRRLLRADDSPATGAGVRVALLDTGIDALQPAFNGVRLIRRDCVGQGHHDDHGHGTHAAGTVLGRPIGGVAIGIAPGVTEALVAKILADYGRGTSAMLFSGLAWALANGARIVLISAELDPVAQARTLIGQGVPVDLAPSLARASFEANCGLLAALLRVAGHGAVPAAPLVVAPAGNASRRRIGADFSATRSGLAADPSVLSVGALGMEEVPPMPARLALAPFSDLAPTLVGPGVGVVSAAAGGGLSALNGTTMAAAHVAGAALLWHERAGPTAFVARMIKAALRGPVPDWPGRLGTGQGLVTLPPPD